MPGVPASPAGQLHAVLLLEVWMVRPPVQPEVQAVKEGTPQMVLEPPAQKPGQLVTLVTLHAVRSPLKEEAPKNVACMLVTLATFQDERSPLKAVAP